MLCLRRKRRQLRCRGLQASCLFVLGGCYVFVFVSYFSLPPPNRDREGEREKEGTDRGGEGQRERW